MAVENYGTEGQQLEIAPLLRRVELFLEDGDWQSAERYCDAVLDRDPENAQAYFLLLLAETKNTSVQALEQETLILEYFPNYGKALRFADSQMQAQLRELANLNHYNRACMMFDAARSVADYNEAASVFEKIADYRDSQKRVEECRELVQNMQQRAAYNSAQNEYYAALSRQSVAGLESAMRKLARMSDYEPAQILAAKCQEEIGRIIEEQKQRTKAAAEKEQRDRQRKRRAIVIVILVAVIAAAVMIWISSSTAAEEKARQEHQQEVQWAENLSRTARRTIVGVTLQTPTESNDQFKLKRGEVWWSEYYVVTFNENGKASYVKYEKKMTKTSDEPLMSFAGDLDFRQTTKGEFSYSIYAEGTDVKIKIGTMVYILNVDSRDVPIGLAKG